MVCRCGLAGGAPRAVAELVRPRRLLAVRRGANGRGGLQGGSREGEVAAMPLMMGMGLQFGAALSGPMLASLMGHAIFGLVNGVVYAWFVRR